MGKSIKSTVMQKRIIFAAFVAMFFIGNGSAEAQILKKLGNALDKIASSSQTLNKEGRKLGKTVVIGDMKMSAFGDNPGVGYNFGGCERQGESVIVGIQFTNPKCAEPMSIGMYNYGERPVQVFGPDGQPYEVALISLDGSSSSEGVSKTIPVNGTLTGFISVKGVPATVKTLDKVMIRCSGHPEMDAVNKSFSFVLENVAVTEPQTAAPIQLSQKGIAPVLISTMVNTIPQKVNGVYDSVNRNTEDFEGEQMTVLEFINNGQIVFSATADETGKIWQIQTQSPSVFVEVGGRRFKVGDKIAPLKSVKGVVVDAESGFDATIGDIDVSSDAGGLIHSFSIGRY